MKTTTMLALSLAAGLGLVHEIQALPGRASQERADVEGTWVGRFPDGVSAEFIAEMRDLDVALEDLDDAMAFRIHGVTREYLRELREAGFEDLDADDMLKLRIHGLDRIVLKRRR